MDTLMKKLKEPQSRRKAYLTSPLVVVDEVGYLPIDTREAYLFFQFVSYRYERSSTLITSNKSFGDWQELFGEQVIATINSDQFFSAIFGCPDNHQQALFVIHAHITVNTVDPEISVALVRQITFLPTLQILLPDSF